MDRSFGICNLSVVPMRAEPSDRSEIKTQLLFGDCFEILEQNGTWIKVLAAYDDYEAWIDHKQIAVLSYDNFLAYKDPEYVTGLAVNQYLTKISTGEVLYLPVGSTLPGISENSLSINAEQYSLSGSIIKPSPIPFNQEVEHAAKFFLQAPYLWGGKTLFGIDCSGFTQIVYKLFNIKIKRDAWQQAEQGRVVDFLPEAKNGDLAFFDNAEGRITHVGIMLGNSNIIHASGRVKIDKIDDQGIYSQELGRYTHHLRIIKRFTD